MPSLNQIANEADFFKWHDIDSVPAPKGSAYIVDLWVVENAVGRKRIIPYCRFNPNHAEYKNGVWEYQVLETTLGAVNNFIKARWEPVAFKPTHWRMTNQSSPEG